MCTLLCFAGPAFSQFKQVHLETDENSNIERVDFYSGSEGYIAFSKTVGFTSDSGKTITYKPITNTNVNFNGYSVNLTFGFELSGVKAFDRNKLLVYGNYGLVPAILYSVNGGSNYKVVFYSQFGQIPNSYVADMAFTENNLVGFAVDKDRILKTTDGGLTWSVNYTFEGFIFTKIQVLNDKVAYAYTTYRPEYGPSFATTDGGNSWQINAVNSGVNYMCFLNANVGWLNTKDGKLLISTDGGNMWIQQNDNVAAPVSFSKMILVNDSTAYATQKDGFEVFKTTNKGKIWEHLHRNNNYSYLGYSLNDIQIKGNTIWAGGGHGYLELSSNSGGMVVPRAYFTIDETAAETTGIIKLNNNGKSGNTYKWLVNNKVIATTYNATYIAELYGPNDIIKLIVANKLYADTLIKVTTFSQAPKITSINPSNAETGQTVTINGENFRNIKTVTFGGVAATSFQVDPYGEYITAVVGKGTSGNIKVITNKAVSTFAGFKYIAPPEIQSFLPTAAARGDTVIIKGKGLDKLSKVLFNDIAAEYSIVSATEVRAVVPRGNATGNITVITNYKNADTAGVFKLKPVIGSLDRDTGWYNTTVEISGIGFFDIKSITLDGNPVLSFSTQDGYNDAPISIKLGEGGKDGKLVITMNNGLTAIYTGFKYFFTPTITSFAPVSGSPGTEVTIAGNNFSTVPKENFIYFGAVRAEVTSATTTSLVVKVPKGATYSPITVAKSYATSTSVRYFTPTYNGGKAISAASFGAQTNLWAGNNARSLAVLDYNSDGKPDISVSAFGDAGAMNYFVENKSIPGNINIALTQSVKLSNGSDSYQDGSVHLAVADWDLDGDLDVILAGLYQRNPAYVKSTYNPGSPYSFPNVVAKVSFWDVDFFNNDSRIPTGIGVADMDGDGQLDFLVSGSFTDHPFFPNLTLCDIDGDGKADVLVHVADTLEVYRNISQKNNIAYAPKVNFLVGSTIGKVVNGDFDNDGKTDIALTLIGTPGITVWKNNSTPGNIALARAATMTTAAKPSSIAIGDLNGDGKVDIGVSNNDKVLLFQNSSGAAIGFNPAVTINLSASDDLVFADLDDDSRPEIIGLEGTGGDPGIRLMRNLNGGPQIASFSPEGGPAGTIIEIQGDGFTGTTAVSIGGTPVRSFKVNSKTSITAVAAEGSKGFIALDGPSGPGTSLSVFHFLPKPIIYVNDYVTNESAMNLGDSARLDLTPYDEQFKVQWYKDGKAITGATNPQLIVKGSGSYTASLVYGNAAPQLSDAVQVRVVLVLPVDNFRVAAANITCRGSNNGSISVHANLPMDYSAVIIGGVNRTVKFKSDAKFEGLPPGDYSVCIAVDNYPEYKQCFNLAVKEPKDLSAYATVNKPNKTVDLALDGADFYNITVNSKSYTATGNVTLPLDNGLNKIAISSDKICQGVIEKLIDLTDNIILYPNPVRDVLNINLGNNVAANATISITGVNGGRVLYSKEVANPYGVLQVNMANFPYGVYVLRLKLDDKENIYKIIKQK